MGLLRKPEEGAWGIMTCPTSLRDVEPGIRLMLIPDPGGPEVPRFEALARDTPEETEGGVRS